MFNTSSLQIYIKLSGTHENAPLKYAKFSENLVANDLECAASFSIRNI
jgi:hypothetical protein